MLKEIKFMIKFGKFLLTLIACIQTMFLAQAYAGENKMYPNADLSCSKVDPFVEKAVKKLEKKYNIALCGIGGGVRDKVWLVNLHFNKYGLPWTEMEARRLIIAISQDFLAMINNEEKIRPYLEYPFTSKNVRIALFSHKGDASDYYHPYITTAAVSEGYVTLTSFDSEKRYVKRVTDIRETYEESLAILAKEKQCE